MGAAPGLQFGKQVANVTFHRLLREEEPDTDLAVHETVRDELEHLELARGRLLFELPHGLLKGNDLSDGRITPSRNGLKTS